MDQNKICAQYMYYILTLVSDCDVGREVSEGMTVPYIGGDIHLLSCL